MARSAPRDDVAPVAVGPSRGDRHNRSLETIQAEIEAARAGALVQARAMAIAMRQVGELLSEARSHVEPAGWPEWIDNYSGMTQRLVGRYLDLAQEDIKPSVGPVARALAAVLNISVAEEIVLPPDVHHMVKGEDVEGRILYLWRPIDDQDRLHVVAIFNLTREYICTDNPIHIDHAREIMTRDPPCGFTLANAHYAIIPIDDAGRDALEDMRRRYVKRGEPVR